MTTPDNIPSGNGSGLTRLRLLQVGGLGMLGLNLPQLLQAGARKSSELSCIFIVQYGGCSHIDSFDPKPDAPEGIRGPVQGRSPRAFPGLRIGELLPRLAGLADRYCLVRSMTHGNGGHDGGMHVCMTGHSQPAADDAVFRLGDGESRGPRTATCPPMSGCKTWPATCSRATSPADSWAPLTVRCALAPTSTTRRRPASA